MWDYSGIVAQIARAVAGDRNLSPATLVLCLSALSKMEWVGQWSNDGVALTAAQWDILEAQIAQAYLELITPSETQTMTVDEFYYIEDHGTDAVSNTGGYAVKTIPFNTDHSENAGNVSRSGSNFNPDAGLYLVFLEVSSFSATKGRVGLYNNTQNEQAIVGNNRGDNNLPRYAFGLVRVETSDQLYAYVQSETSGYLGEDLSITGLDEWYAKIVWSKLSE